MSSFLSPLRPPTLNGCISLDSLPIPRKITTAFTRPLVPQHEHTNIHQPSSFQWLTHAFTHHKSNFKWVSNISCCQCSYSEYDMPVYKCPLCSMRHLMNPVSVLALCMSGSLIQQKHISARPMCFSSLVQCWFYHKTNPGEKHTSVGNSFRFRFFPIWLTMASLHITCLSSGIRPTDKKHSSICPSSNLMAM